MKGERSCLKRLKILSSASIFCADLRNVTYCMLTNCIQK